MDGVVGLKFGFNIELLVACTEKVCWTGFVIAEPLNTTGSGFLTPVEPTYFSWILEGWIPPGLLIMLAHFGMCL